MLLGDGQFLGDETFPSELKPGLAVLGDPVKGGGAKAYFISGFFAFDPFMFAYLVEG
jgi:hypothetical protein